MDAMMSRLFKDLGMSPAAYPDLAGIEYSALKCLSDEDLAETYRVTDATLRHTLLRKVSENHTRPSFRRPPNSQPAEHPAVKESALLRRTSVAGRAPAPLPSGPPLVTQPKDASAAGPAVDSLSVSDLTVVARRSGWMCKQGFVVKNWKMRWFVLDATSLYYYSTPQSDRPKGIIALNGYLATIVVVPKREHTFKLQHPFQRDWYFSCTDKGALEKWIAAIQIVATKGALPGVPSNQPCTHIAEEDLYAPVIDDRTNFEIKREVGHSTPPPISHRSPAMAGVSSPLRSPPPPPSPVVTTRATTRTTTTAPTVDATLPPTRSPKLSTETCLFFFDGFTREDAERRIPLDEGAYLLRQTAGGDVACITGYWDADYRHFKLFEASGGFQLAKSQPAFATQTELLAHYRTHNLPNAIAGSPRLLTRPIHRA